jgi:6-phosphofructokinase
VDIGGTILGSSRTNPYKNQERDVPRVVENYRKMKLDALVAVGGDDTLEIAYYLHRDHGLNIVGVPKTIDNDVPSTDFTFGFMSAVEKATADFDRLRTTARSHRRVLVVECMGRHAGWITAYTGLAGEADFIAVPEKQCSLREMADALKRAREKGRQYNLVALAEGASVSGLEEYVPKGQEKKERDVFGNIKIAPGDLCRAVAKGLEALSGFETRYVTLGHLQRGGNPAAYDRILGSRYGLGAARAILDGRFGVLISFDKQQIVVKPLSGSVRESQKDPKKYKLLDPDFLADAAELCW